MARRVLVKNWRDVWHPRAGGAELLTLRVVERLAARGWEVEWFSAAYPGAAAREVRDGISYVRAGQAHSVHWQAFRHYRRTTGFDVVVDEVNTLPFLSPLYTTTPVVALFQQLAREVWFYESRFPIAPLGYLAEPIYLQGYRRTPIVTISRSSAQSLRAVGLRGPIDILPIAVDEAADDRVPEKTAPADIVTIGRLTPSKRIGHVIAAAGELARNGWRGRLHVVGGGEPAYVDGLRKLARDTLRDRIIVHGRIDDAARRLLLQRCSVLWMASVREGWGLVVTEAARHGTPAVVYDVPGLRDAVSDGETGYVVPARPAALALATQRLLGAEYGETAQRTLARARGLSWDATTDAFERAIERAIG